MRIAIVGAGAMGSLFGALLSTVANVWLVDPWEEHIAAIRRDGLRLIEPNGERSFTISATTNPLDAAPTDLAIIQLKSYQTKWGAEVARDILKENGLALTLQNGVGNYEVLCSVLGTARAWQGVTTHGATLLGPGRVRHAGSGPTHLDARPDLAERAEEVARLFQRAGLETHFTENIDGLVWGKLLVNVGINALTALLRVPNGVLSQNPVARTLLEKAVAEAAQVVRAKGIDLPYEDPIAKTLEVAVATGANRSSMLQDVLRGTPTEIDVINGAVVREAGLLGLSAPVNEMLAELIKAIEETYRSRILGS